MSELVEWFYAFPRPVIIAHRGASAYYPENTMPAIKSAMEAGADMIEVDVQMSADEVPVIAHDPDLERTAFLKKRISDLSWEQLQQIDVGSWFHPRFAEIRILSLQQLLRMCAHSMPLNLEVKFQYGSRAAMERAIKKVLTEVCEHEMNHKVIISGFDHKVASMVKKNDSHIATAILYNPINWKRALPSRLVENSRADFFHCSWKQYGKQWQQDLENHHIPVNVYTVNQTTTYKRMRELGINGVFTDRPDMLIKYEKQLNKNS